MMKRLQREFLTLSTLAHAVLIAMLLFGTAFLAKPQPPEQTELVTLLEFIPDELVDENVAHQGGAPPEPVPAPRRRPEPPAKPPPAPPQPQPKPVPKPAPKAAPKPEPPKPEPRKRWTPADKIKVNLNKVRHSDPAAQRRAERARQQREAERRRELARSLDRLRQGLSSQIKYSVPGAGGASYANYAAYVRTLYDRAWREPASTSSRKPLVKTRVVIARDGRVLSAKIVEHSGDATLDRSVEAVLDRIKNIGRPFPKSTKDQQRSFILNFNLIAKQGAG